VIFEYFKVCYTAAGNKGFSITVSGKGGDHRIIGWKRSLRSSSPTIDGKNRVNLEFGKLVSEV